MHRIHKVSDRGYSGEDRQGVTLPNFLTRVLAMGEGELAASMSAWAERARTGTWYQKRSLIPR